MPLKAGNDLIVTASFVCDSKTCRKVTFVILPEVFQIIGTTPLPHRQLTCSTSTSLVMWSGLPCLGTTVVGNSHTRRHYHSNRITSAGRTATTW